MNKKSYKTALRQLQIELVKLQRHFIACDDKVLVLPEVSSRITVGTLECPLLGVKRKSISGGWMSACSQERT